MGVGIYFPIVPDATSLSEDDSNGLLPSHIVTTGQLNEWEQVNILVAERWALTNRRLDLLSEPYVRALHRRMFNLTWRWAGKYRHYDTSIGDPHYLIPGLVRQVVDDAGCWAEHRTFEIDELAVRLHHRLVKVHPFPNGNGRHARLMADVLLRRRGMKPLTWGAGTNLRAAGQTRATYIAALKRADNLDYGSLIEFARS